MYKNMHARAANTAHVILLRDGSKLSFLFSNWNFQTLSTALYEACQTGRLEMSKYLIYAGADVNKMYKVLVRFMNQVFCVLSEAFRLKRQFYR